MDARSLQTLIHLKDRKEELSDIKFSPGMISHLEMMGFFVQLDGSSLHA